VFNEIHLFEACRTSKESINLALGVESRFQPPQSFQQPSQSPNQQSSSLTKEKKKFVREICENGVHNPKVTSHKEENCFVADPQKAFLYIQQKQAKNVKAVEGQMDNLKTFAFQVGRSSPKEIILDSGASVLMLNNRSFLTWSSKRLLSCILPMVRRLRLKDTGTPLSTPRRDLCFLVVVSLRLNYLRHLWLWRLFCV
jgi:hypothetical protein